MMYLLEHLCQLTFFVTHAIGTFPKNVVLASLSAGDSSIYSLALVFPLLDEPEAACLAFRSVSCTSSPSSSELVVVSSVAPRAVVTCADFPFGAFLPARIIFACFLACLITYKSSIASLSSLSSFCEACDRFAEVVFLF